MVIKKTWRLESLCGGIKNGEALKTGRVKKQLTGVMKTVVHLVVSVWYPRIGDKKRR